jgi:Protein of unknown function (DUF1592)/Protein of unknown function (DUF1588)/Protein of unknown function (DUF1595)/Protein of unknown function (DUF1585)/Protein of unknown function (DUF1587)
MTRHPERRPAVLASGAASTVRVVLAVSSTLAVFAGGCKGYLSGGATAGGPTTGQTAGIVAGGSTPGPSTLSRLTAVQYQNTLRDLFAPVVVPAQTLPADISVDGYDDNASAQTPSAALIEAYRGAAVAVATAAMTNPGQMLGCTPATPADEDACAAAFLGAFGRRAFRHPVTADEQSNLQAFYAAERAGGVDFATALTLTIEAILQSPSFLYRVELGAPGATWAPAAPGLRPLTGYEMASRLSYLLWNSMPDEELFSTAASGGLDTPAGIEAEARRLLADPRAHDAVANFHRQWLRFDTMNNLTKGAAAFPTFTPDTAVAMRASAEKFVDGIFFGDGTLTALLTDAHAWVDDTLAPLYGVASPGSGAALTLVPLDASQRSGILTDVGLLAGFAHETTDSPVLRGVFVLDRFMCAPTPPPPANVNTTLPPTADPGAPETTRQRFTAEHEQGTCMACHHLIDGVGFGFEHYDAVGRWRDTELGLPVDASGWLPAEGDLGGTFDGAVDLGQRLAASRSVQSCVASQWLQYALGVDHTGVDASQLQPIVDAFVAGGANMRELVIALVKSDAFRTRLFGP